MSKSKLRSKILNLRKKNSNKKLSLNLDRIYRFLKKNKINFKKEIDANQKKYENLIDEAADQISNFVKKAKLENISK